MADLIWVGNTLLPRGVVFFAAFAILLIVAGMLARITSALSRPELGSAE